LETCRFLAKVFGSPGELVQLFCIYEHEKEYKVLLTKRPDETRLDAWRRGVVLEDGYKSAPARFERRRAKAPGCGFSWARDASARFVKYAGKKDCRLCIFCGCGLAHCASIT
jgi:hypothetical protein